MGLEAAEGKCPWVQGGVGKIVTEASWGYRVGEQGLSWQEAFCRDMGRDAQLHCWL